MSVIVGRGPAVMWSWMGSGLLGAEAWLGVCSDVPVVGQALSVRGPLCAV